MAEVILMPKLSDTMTEGVVAEWNKSVGDTVASGELLAEIETDKATMEFESFYDGILLHIGVEKGQNAPVNTLLAIIGEKGEDVAKIIAEVEKDASGKEDKKPTPEPVRAVEEVKKAIPVAASTPVVDTLSDGRLTASPLARKMALKQGIDLKSVLGTGEGGRIVKRDIEHYVPYTSRLGGGKRDYVGTEKYTDEPISPMRKTIAKRLAESKFTYFSANFIHSFAVCKTYNRNK